MTSHDSSQKTSKQLLLSLLTPKSVDSVESQLIEGASIDLARDSTPSSFDLLKRWRGEVGPENFERISKIHYKTMWARHRDSQFYDFHRLLEVARGLGKLPEEGSPRELFEIPAFRELQDAWLHDCATLGRPKAVARVHVLLAVANVKAHASTLHKDSQLRLSERLSDAVAHFHPLPWDALQPVLSFLRAKDILVPGNPLEQQIRTECSSDTAQVAHSFESKLQSLAQAQSIDHAMLADLFGLREADVSKCATVVARAFKFKDYDRRVAPGVLALLLAQTNEEAAELLEQKRNELAESLKCQGRYVSRASIERKLWKVDYEDLPFPKQDIQHVEWGKEMQSLTEDSIIQHSLQLGLEKAREVLLRWHNLHDYSSIRSSLSSLLYRAPQQDLQSELATSATRLVGIAVGEEPPPPLPTTKRFLERAASVVTPRLERDWFNSYAMFQIGANQSDLARLVSTYIASISDTKAELLEGQGLSRQASSQLFLSLNVSGTVSNHDLEVIAHALRIDRDSPMYLLLSLVRAEGTITNALPSFVQELRACGDTETLGGLEALKRSYEADLRAQKSKQYLPIGELLDIRQGRSSGDKRLHGEPVAMNCLRSLPGLTAQEVCSIDTLSSISLPERFGVIKTLVDRANERGISEKDLAAALHKGVPGIRQSYLRASSALGLRLATPLTAPAVLAHFVSTDESELKQLLHECRAHAEAELVSARLTPTPLLIEMRIWGLRYDDIRIPRQTLMRLLWNPKRNSDAVAAMMSQMQEIGSERAANALARFVSHRRASLIPDVVRMFLDHYPGGEKDLAIDANLKFGKLQEYAAGEDVPPLRNFKAMAKSCAFTLTSFHGISHRLALAENLGVQRLSPLVHSMMYLARILDRGADDPTDERSTPKSVSTHLLQKVHLDTPSNVRLFIDRSVDSPDYWRLSAKILTALGHPRGSPMYDYMQCLYLYRDVPTALAHWGKASLGAESSFPAIEPLQKLCSQMIKSPVVEAARLTVSGLLSEKEQCLLMQHDESTVAAALRVLESLPGIKISDLVEVPEDSHYAQIFSSLRERVPVSTSASTTSPAEERERAADRQLREDDERNLVTERGKNSELVKAEQERERVISKFLEQCPETQECSPDSDTLQLWADTLADILKNRAVSQLPRRYQTLRLDVATAPNKGFSYERAFVLKALQLLSADTQRSKAASGPERETKTYRIEF